MSKQKKRSRESLGEDELAASEVLQNSDVQKLENDSPDAKDCKRTASRRRRRRRDVVGGTHIPYVVQADPRGLMREERISQPLSAPTFDRFAKEAKGRGVTVAEVAQALGNDDPYSERLALARRVFDPRYARTQIPYRSLCRIYSGWLAERRSRGTAAGGDASTSTAVPCACGCGRLVVGRSNRIFATDACRKRARRVKERPATVGRRAHKRSRRHASRRCRVGRGIFRGAMKNARAFHTERNDRHEN